MDCEKFDQHVIDALYDELDELTDAALERHVEGCTRCAQIYSQLKDAREAATMPLVEPSSGLEERILAAERATLRKAPLHNKVIRGIAWAGSLAMRPQLAMAALFMLVVGSSLLLLRGKPNALNSPTQVTQRGEPGEEEAPQRAKSDTRAAKPESATPTMGGAARKMSESVADNVAPQALATAAPAEAPPSPMPAASAAAGGDAQGELDEAEKTKVASGCGAAVPKFEGIVGRYPNTPEGLLAQGELEKCRPGKTPASPASKPNATILPPSASASGGK